MPVRKTMESKKHDKQIPIGQNFSPNKSFNVYLKTTPPRSGLRWKPTGIIFSNFCLRWIPTGKLFNSCTGKVDSEPTHGSNVDISHIHACKQYLDLSASTSFNGQKQQRINLSAGGLYDVKQENLRVWLLKKLISQKPVPQCSEIGIHDHSNELSSSKLVPKVDPQVVKTATSRQEAKDCQGRLLASFQDDAKYEHVGQVTRSQGDENDKDKQGQRFKDLKTKTKSKHNDKSSRSKIAKHKGTILQRR
ncbi:hypothetical protein Tco_1438588 [Tanacetum coccineum]